MRDGQAPLNPPRAIDVARRAAILKYLFIQVLATPPLDVLSSIMAPWSDSDRESFLQTLESRRKELIGALVADGLWEHCTDDECTVFNAPAKQITERQRINVSWRAESIACFAWAFGLIESLPAYDTQVDPENAVKAIPLEASARADLVLRPRREIELARDLAELWHWRSRTRELAGSSFEKRAEFEKYDAIVRQAAQRAATDGVTPAPIDGDFPAFQRAYRDLSAEEWAFVQSIAMERHFALNWLCGYASGNEWDETPTDT
jgi:hypothetical protein